MTYKLDNIVCKIQNLHKDSYYLDNAIVIKLLCHFDNATNTSGKKTTDLWIFIIHFSL